MSMRQRLHTDQCRRSTLRHRRLAAFAGTLAPLGMLAAGLLLAANGRAAESQPGSWEMHQTTFNYLGIEPTYSCIGLNEGLTFLLRESGARLDAPVHASPCNGSAPTKLLAARLKFSTLKPETGGGGGEAASGSWHHVEFSPTHSSPALRGGDCELVEEFRDKLLPMFTTRNVQSNLRCVPYQTIGHQFSLTFDVFAPADATRVGGAVGRH